MPSRLRQYIAPAGQLGYYAPMARSHLRARSALTASLLALPAACLIGACSSKATTARSDGGSGSFGDAAPIIVKHDSGVKDATRDVAHDAPKDVEVDVALPTDAAAATPCVKASECASGVCAPGVIGDGGQLFDAGICEPHHVDGGSKVDAAHGCECQAPTCHDGVKNGAETGVDCGGPTCAACAIGQGCTQGTDCLSKDCGGVPSSGKCPAPVGDGGAVAADAGSCVCETSCSDGVKNGSETDVDCGGSQCPACGTGKACVATGDCASSVCTAGSGGSTCACPSDMTLVATGGQTRYCVDNYEVTYAQYQSFTTNAPPTSSQPAYCAWNTSFVPSQQAVQSGAAAAKPVAFVNWCDALAYCTANKRHLCGAIAGSTPGAREGEAVPYPVGGATGAAVNTASVDEWYNACSLQGTNAYPYSNTYSPTVCNGVDSPAQKISGPVNVPPGTAGDRIWTTAASCALDACNTGANGLSTIGQGQQITCQQGAPADGGVKPGSTSCGAVYADTGCYGGATTVFDMSGNVAEWENSCNGTGGATDTCLVRGGAFDTVPGSSTLTCAYSAAQATVARNATAADIGFRCCL